MGVVALPNASFLYLVRVDCPLNAYQKSDVKAVTDQMHAVLGRRLWITRSKAIFCMLVFFVSFSGKRAPQ